jgi:hypothetical protein
MIAEEMFCGSCGEEIRARDLKWVTLDGRQVPYPFCQGCGEEMEERYLGFVRGAAMAEATG